MAIDDSFGKVNARFDPIPAGIVLLIHNSIGNRLFIQVLIPDGDPNLPNCESDEKIDGVSEELIRTHHRGMSIQAPNEYHVNALQQKGDNCSINYYKSLNSAHVYTMRKF